MSGIHKIVSMRKQPGVIVVGSNGSSHKEVFHTLKYHMDSMYRQYFDHHLGMHRSRARDVIIPVLHHGHDQGYVRIEAGEGEHYTDYLPNEDYSSRGLNIQRPTLLTYFNTNEAYRDEEAFLEYARMKQNDAR